MRITEQQQLRDKTAALVLEWAEVQQPPFTGETTEGFADAIVAAHLIADEGRIGLHRWIYAARRAGLSWSDIGDALGVTKQAAQQRFKSLERDEEMDVQDGEEVIRLGATAFNEMWMLHKAGDKCLELVRIGALTLVFRRSDHAWEYRRRVGASPAMAEMEEAGWTYVSSWLPFHYFKRPLASA